MAILVALVGPHVVGTGGELNEVATETCRADSA